VALSSYYEENVALARELQRTLLEREKERRRDHDRLQELKGNIRVFCRVRPALSKYIKCTYFGGLLTRSYGRKQYRDQSSQYTILWR
jgi:hypothetical protein